MWWDGRPPVAAEEGGAEDGTYEGGGPALGDGRDAFHGACDEGVADADACGNGRPPGVPLLPPRPGGRYGCCCPPPAAPCPVRV